MLLMSAQVEQLEATQATKTVFLVLVDLYENVFAILHTTTIL